MRDLAGIWDDSLGTRWQDQRVSTRSLQGSVLAFFSYFILPSEIKIRGLTTFTNLRKLSLTKLLE